MMTVIGMIVILAIDVAVPLGLATWLIVLNARRHRSMATELKFWLLASPLVLAVWAATVASIRVFSYDGGPVGVATFLGLPGSVIPTIATVALSKAFFDEAAWASIAYFVVMPAYLAGIVLWELLLFVTMRRGDQHSRRTRTLESSQSKAG